MPNEIEIKDAEDKLLATLPKDGTESIYDIWHLTNPIEKAWPVLDAALTASNPSNEVIQIQKELGRLIKQGTNFSGGKVTSQQVKDEIKKLDDAREVAQKAKLQTNNDKQPELTPEQKAAQNNAWEVAKDLSRFLTLENRGKIGAALPPEVQRILGINGLSGNELSNKLSKIFNGNIPDRNDSPDWGKKVFKNGVKDEDRPQFAQIIKQLADKFQSNPDLMDQVNAAIQKGQIGYQPTANASVVGQAGGATSNSAGATGSSTGSSAPTAAPAPSADMQAVQAQNQQLKDALQSEANQLDNMTKSMKDFEQKADAAMQQDREVINDLSGKVDILKRYDNGLVGADKTYKLVQGMHPGFFHKIFHLGHDNPEKNKNLMKFVSEVDPAGNTDFKQDVIAMYHDKKGISPENLQKTAGTLGAHSDLLARVDEIYAGSKSTHMKAGAPDRNSQAYYNSSVDFNGADPMPTSSANFTNGRQAPQTTQVDVNVASPPTTAPQQPAADVQVTTRVQQPALAVPTPALAPAPAPAQ